MSETPTPEPRGVSPLWVLLILPVALIIGWAIGQLPTPNPEKPAAATAQSGPTIEAPAKFSPMGAATSVGGGTGTRASERPTVESGRASEETPRGPFSQWTTLEGAMAESQRDGKPILIDFSADWCGPCQRMKQQVFEDGSMGQAIQTAVIPVSIVDRSRENGSNPPEIENLQRQFHVEAFPTLVVFSPATGRAMRTQGFGDAQSTLGWITEAAKAVR